MLSNSKISSSAGASEYFSGENYYIDSEEVGVWAGQGAKDLNLIGAISEDDFVKALDGNLTNDDGKTPHPNHTPGWDFTLSAPKDVSVLALVLEDERLIKAHDTAVDQSLELAERGFATARKTVNGDTKNETTGNLCIAQFSHYLSRNNDPQIHTHNVIINQTKRKDGKHCALDSRTLYKAHTAIAHTYNNVLAREVAKLGYEIERDGKHCAFKIANVPDDLRDRFSSRREDILNHIKDAKHDTPKSRATATLLSRPAKTKLSKDDLHTLWKDKLGRDKELLENLKSSAQEKTIKTETAIKFVDDALENLSERHSTFTMSTLLGDAIENGFVKTTHTQIEAEILSRVKSGELHLKQNGYQKELTSQKLVALERETFHIAQTAFPPAPHIFDNVKDVKTDFELSSEQWDAVDATLNSPHPVIVIQGDAGTGKTSALKLSAAAANLKGHEIVGLAPTHTAKREMQSANVPATTIDAYLNASEKIMKNKILVVDESSMIGTSKLHALFSKLKSDPPLRIVLMGDKKQLAAIDAGMPFTQAQKSFHTVFLTDIRRQQTKPLNQAARFASQGDYKQALEQLDTSIIETGHRDLTQTAFKQWKSAPGTPMIVTATHAVKDQITDYIRQDLYKSEKLGGIPIQWPVLQSKSLTPSGMRQSRNYEAKDQIRFIEGRPSQGFTRGSQWSVLNVDHDKNALLLTNGIFDRVLLLGGAGKPLKLEVSKSKEIELAQHDKVRLTRRINDDFLSGDEFTIAAYDEGKTICLQRAGDAEWIEIDINTPIGNALDHNYAITTHASQGKSADHVIAVIDTKQASAFNVEQFYTQITRCKQSLKVVVDDKDRLEDMLEEASPTLSAVEFVETLEDASWQLEDETSNYLDRSKDFER